MSNSFNIQEENLDVGECSVHNRLFECFSMDSFKLICPSCLMFGPHKGENVCSIEEAGRFLRERLDEANKKGLFKVDKTETVLLDIRQVKLSCEETKQRVIREVDFAFTEMIKKLKERRAEVMKEVEDHYTHQLEKIAKNEQTWTEKQEVSLELVNLAKSPNDLAIVQRAKFIMDGIATLNNQLNYHTTELLNSFDLYFRPGGNKGKDIDPKELVKLFENYGQKGEIIKLNYRC